MKLIDLLVQELPKRGGWPKNVTHIGQDYDRELMFYGKGSAMTGIFLNELAIDHRKLGRSGAKVTREQYESALAASQNPAWSGEGLPPVGCECELKYKCHDDDAYWERVIILWQRGDDTLVEYAGENFKNTTQLIHKTSMHVDFRPLRTESERKHEAVLESICSVLEMVAQDYKREDEAKLIYEAIAAGKIPGVRLED